MADLWARVIAEGKTDEFLSLRGPIPETGYLSDGCTHCPDIGPTGEPLWMACYKHDWCYDVLCTDIPNTEKGREDADDWLWFNLVALGLDKPLADAIWEAVRKEAGSHFKTLT